MLNILFASFFSLTSFSGIEQMDQLGDQAPASVLLCKDMFTQFNESTLDVLPVMPTLWVEDKLIALVLELST